MHGDKTLLCVRCSKALFAQNTKGFVCMEDCARFNRVSLKGTGITDSWLAAWLGALMHKGAVYFVNNLLKLQTHLTRLFWLLFLEGVSRARDDVRCGVDGCDSTNDPLDPCLPIPVPNDDLDFPTNRCLKFVRSMSVPLLNCQIGMFTIAMQDKSGLE
jgi:hypothetical protein